MSDRDYPNSGILFRDDSKRSDKDRDYRGTANVDCRHCGAHTQFWLSAWVKNGRRGKFMSLSFKAKHADQRAAQSQEA